MTKSLYLIILLFALSFFGHNKDIETIPKTEKKPSIKNHEVYKHDLVLNQNEGKWYYHNKPFNGYSIKCYPNGVTSERLGYLNGKREGIAKRWENNGLLRIESFYKQNRLTGTYKVWWKNGELTEESIYENGALHGVQKMYYPDGSLAKKRQLVNGREEGLQKSWLKNGKLYINYEAKNGRIFGMKRANSCYKLEDEIVVRSKKI
ncbi:Toxin-antitoxin system YwqK family antitoxin [Zobellia roscoffensis]|uniref:toxin-antitoxin system YwqK family antitoxin n=1 Tax=Zobellia roscoffensis TaxID=2779508 RepID=UPI00188B5A66|nr:hypothetical protein [Zobellia roscoffensis]